MGKVIDKQAIQIFGSPDDTALAIFLESTIFNIEELKIKTFKLIVLIHWE